MSLGVGKVTECYIDTFMDLVENVSKGVKRKTINMGEVRQFVQEDRRYNGRFLVNQGL